MKVTPEHLAALRAAIQPIDDTAGRALYLAGDFPNAHLVQDLNKRYRWDCMWAIEREIRVPLIDEIYKYADDNHLDTALRAIVPPL